MNKTLSLKFKFFSILSIIFIVFLTTLIYFEYHHLTKDFIEEQNIKNTYIKKNTNTFLESLKYDISTKTDFILSNNKLKKALHDKNRKKLYNQIKAYYERQKQLNPYMKIMTFRLPDGSAFLRVHKPEFHGDKLNKKRKIIIDTNISKVKHFGFEIGKLKMTYRVVTPIFYKKEYLGLIEIGIEPEYIIDKVSTAYDIEHALLVKKEDLSINITKKGNIKKIGNFAMVRGTEFFNSIDINNINLDKKQNELIKFNKIPHLIETNLNLYDHKGNVAAKILFASEIKNYDRRDNALISSVIFFLILLAILFLLINYIVNKFMSIQEKQINIIKQQSREINAIFNGALSMIVLSDGKVISKANDQFFKFFDKYENIEQFKKEYDCICDKFEDIELPNYVKGKTIEGTVWSEYIAKHPNMSFKAGIKKDGILHHFLVKVKEIKFNDQMFNVVDLSDISKEVEQQERIERQSKLISNQTKMAALGEMIGNIAHQWRQPLSVISTSASGMQIQQTLGILDNDELHDNLEAIVKNTKFLSQTINDFRDFIKGDKKIEEFSLTTVIHQSVNILQSTLKNNHIQNTLALKDVKLRTFKNELIQALNNIINNSVDVLKENDSIDKFIFIESSVKDNNAIIKIKDNGDGIPENIIEKIFEPYFTTKHQSQGTGLGLYMTHKIIKESLKGKIEVSNINFNYRGKEYKGVEFVISIPIEKD